MSEIDGGASIHKHTTFALDGSSVAGGLQPALVKAVTDEEYFGTGPCRWSLSRIGIFDDDVSPSGLVTVRDLDPATSTISIALSTPIFPAVETGEGCWESHRADDPAQDINANMPEVSFATAVDPLSVSGHWTDPSSMSVDNGGASSTFFQSFDWHLTRDADTDRDGVSDSADLCPDTPVGTPVQDAGCSRGILHWGPQTTSASSPFALQTHELSWDTEFAVPFINPGDDLAFSQLETIDDTLTPEADATCGVDVLPPQPAHTETATPLWPLVDVDTGDVLGGTAHDLAVVNGLRVYDAFGDCFHHHTTNTVTGVFPGSVTQSLLGCYQLGLAGGTSELDTALFSGSVSVVAIGVDPVTCVPTGGGPTVPGAPTIGTATAGIGQATVAFNAPASDGGSSISGYTASCVSSGDGVTRSGTGSSSPIMVANLTNGAPYTCTVTATNDVGTGAPSAPSNAFTPVAPTRPGVPGLVTATAGDQRATVSWSAPSSDGGSPIKGYLVVAYVGLSPVRSTIFMSTATTQTMVQLTNGTLYRFRVRAINAAGVGDASKVSNPVTPRTVPGAPTIGTAAAGNARATVTWTPPASDGGAPITPYVVTPYVGYWPLPSQTFGPSARTATVTGLTNGTTYRFRVQAVNSAGHGAYSTVTNPIIPHA